MFMTVALRCLLPILMVAHAVAGHQLAKRSAASCANGAPDPANPGQCCPRTRLAATSSGWKCCTPDQQNTGVSCCPTGVKYTSTGTCCPPNTDVDGDDNCCPSGQRFDCGSDTCCAASDYSPGDGCCAPGTIYTSDNQQFCCHKPPINFFGKTICSDASNAACSASNPCADSTMTCYDGVCRVPLNGRCNLDGDCSQAAAAGTQYSVACRLATFSESVQANVDAYRGIPTCQFLLAGADNTFFGRCDPNDPNACPPVKTLYKIPEWISMTCKMIPRNGDYACFVADGSRCYSPGYPLPSRSLPGYDAPPLENGRCASGYCDLSTTKCTQPPSQRRVRRRSVNEQPAVFRRSGMHRELLSVPQAIAMITGHGVFEHNGKYIRDSTFMRKRSRWEASIGKAADVTARVVQKWSPDTFADVATRALSRKAGQFALSDNFKIQSWEAPAIIRGVLADPAFESFDWEYLTVDRANLEALLPAAEAIVRYNHTARAL